MNSENSYDQYLDARNLSCPLPLLKAKQHLNQLSSGQVLFIQTTDPGSWNDFASYAKLSKHTLLSRKKSDHHFHFLLRKGD